MAEFVIEQFKTPYGARPDDIVTDIFVRVANRGGGRGFDRGVVIVFAGNLNPSDIIYECFNLAPGDRVTLSGCSIEECSGGRFVMPDEPVEFEVVLGEVPPDASCTNDDAINVVDTATATVIPTDTEQVTGPTGRRLRH